MSDGLFFFEEHEVNYPGMTEEGSFDTLKAMCHTTSSSLLLETVPKGKIRPYHLAEYLLSSKTEKFQAA